MQTTQQRHAALLATVFVFAIASGIAQAEDTTEKVSGKEHKLIVLAPKTTGDTVIKWDCPKDGIDSTEQGKVLVITGKPGVYTVKATMATPSKAGPILLSMVTYTVTIDADGGKGK